MAKLISHTRSMVDVLGMLEYRERKSDQNKIIVTIVDVDYDEACEGEILGIRVRNPGKGNLRLHHILWLHENNTKMSTGSVDGAHGKSVEISFQRPGHRVHGLLAIFYYTYIQAASNRDPNRLQLDCSHLGKSISTSSR
jgi:hypothetical protein